MASPVLKGSLKNFERFDKSLFICFDNFLRDEFDRMNLVSSREWYVLDHLTLLCKGSVTY